MTKKIRRIGIGVLVAVWVILTGFVWFSPAKESSDAERRLLAQLPKLNVETILSGKFMSKFEAYTQDQFPARDTIRQLKSLFHYYVLGQKDNHDIYIADGYAAKLEYPLNESGVQSALKRFQAIYEMYLTGSGSKIYSAVVPDKGYYLAQENGYLAMDYKKLFTMVQDSMPWATHVDLTDRLSKADYYRTDTHWRQENLLPVAEKLASVMGVSAPKAEDFEKVLIERPFYGVYYGQAALPMDAEELYVLRSKLLDACTVYRMDTDSYGPVYDMEKLTSKDLYDVFLSGPQSLLRIENPNAKTDRELIIFRDSFGSSLAPLLVQDYAAVTLVDLRYIPSAMLEGKVDFTEKDVLFLYSTTILNTGSALK